MYILAKDVNTEKFEIKAKKKCGLKKAYFWMHPNSDIDIEKNVLKVLEGWGI